MTWLARATLLAALTETVVLRVATRTAIHVPGIEQLAAPYGVVAGVGRWAHHAASLLVALTLVALGRSLVGQGRRAEAAAAGLVLVTAVAARLGAVDDLTLAMAVGAAVAGLAAAAVRCGAGPRLPVALFAAAFTVSAVHAVTQALSGAGALRPASTVPLLVVAEVLVLAATVGLPAALPGVSRRDLAMGVVAGLVVLAAFTASTATSTILLLWTFGLAGYLPVAVYAVAAGALVAGLGALGRGSQPDRMVGLALVALGGVGLHSSYQSGLVVAGLALLVASAPVVATTTARATGGGRARAATFPAVPRPPPQRSVGNPAASQALMPPSTLTTRRPPAASRLAATDER